MKKRNPGALIIVTAFCQTRVGRDLSRRSILQSFPQRSHLSARELIPFEIVDIRFFVGCLEETPDHVFWECPEYKEQQELLRAALVCAAGYLPHSVDSLVVCLDKDITSAVG